MRSQLVADRVRTARRPNAPRQRQDVAPVAVPIEQFLERSPGCAGLFELGKPAAHIGRDRFGLSQHWQLEDPSAAGFEDTYTIDGPESDSSGATPRPGGSRRPKLAVHPLDHHDRAG